MKKQIQLSDHFTYGRLIRFTLPSIGMMIFMSIYSVVDGYFVSNFAGKTPFAALNLIFPVLMIMATVGFMFGTGGSAIVAKTFGLKDHESANRYFSLFVYVAFGLGVILAVVSIVFLRPIAIALGAEDQLLEDVEPEQMSMKEASLELIEKALQKHGGKRKAAAKELGISERTIYRKLDQLKKKK